MFADVVLFLVTLLLVVASLISLIYIVAPGNALSAEKKFERRLEFSIFAMGGFTGLLVLTLML